MADRNDTSPRLACRACGGLIHLHDMARDHTDGPPLVCPGGGAVLVGNESPSGPFPSLSGSDAFTDWSARHTDHRPAQLARVTIGDRRLVVARCTPGRGGGGGAAGG